MGSGARSIQINTQERVLSSDINRLQAFIGATSGEVFRALLDSSANDDVEAGAVASNFLTLASPMRAEVLQGLMVRPDPAGGTLNLAVDSGSMYAVAPTLSADDSVYQYVADAGVLVSAGLVMTANSSGSTRVDVVECQFNATPATVTSSRDVFNPVTGLFTATTVTKETKAQLTYRVRLGTPGAGFPGTASGWLPLCVATVPTGTTTNNTIVFYDVRPLLNDREFGLAASSRTYPKRVRGSAWSNCLSVASTSFPFRGLFEATLAGRRVGGQVMSGTSTSDAVSCDLTAAVNQATGFSLASPGLAHLYLCTPYGLPRWARYSNGPTNRVPRSPRGIYVLSNVVPGESGVASATVAPPATTGFSTAMAAAACAYVASTPITGGALVGGFQLDDEWVLLQQGTAAPLTVAGVNGASEFDTTDFTFTRDTHFPRCAKSLLTFITGGSSLTAPNIDMHVDIYEPGSTANVLHSILVPFTFTRITAGTHSFQARVEIPLPTPAPGSAWGASQKITLRHEFASGTVAGSTATVQGWRL